MALRTVEGKIGMVSNHDKKIGYVIFFLSPECPLCQSYSLTIKNLQQKYQSKGVSFVAVVPGKEYSIEKIITYRNGYGLKMMPFYLDTNYAFSKQINATITPEVFVLNQQNQLVYSGRIDNWGYELGKKRSVITAHDLDDVLNKLVYKKPFKSYQTKAVGCFIN